MDREIDMLCRPLRGRSRWIAGVALHAALLSACTFSPEGGFQPDPDTGPQPPDDGGTVDMGVPTDTLLPVDAPIDAPSGPQPENVVHVPEEGWVGGTADATWTGTITIDTTNLTISGPGAEGLTLRAQAHDPSSGPELALLHVGTLTVNDGVNVSVTGSRPLVIISSETIVLNGRIDAGAALQSPGAGGAAPRGGEEPGQSGFHTTSTPNDGGGGGGGHATTGARGGRGCPTSGIGLTTCDDTGVAQGGPGGDAYGDQALSTLFGGSGGGRGGEGDGSCAGGEGGAGGGAVQLYALDTITIGANGGVSVGGGGGQGGQQEGSCVGSGGGGGGSGGSVYLQAENLRIDGVIAANGGGGGSGASGAAGGDSGDNGALVTTQAAGGADPGEGASAGGDGAASTSGPDQGDDDSGEPNAGGGGGAGGRIALNCNEVSGNGGRFSPPAILQSGCRQD